MVNFEYIYKYYHKIHINISDIFLQSNDINLYSHNSLEEFEQLKEYIESFNETYKNAVNWDDQNTKIFQDTLNTSSSNVKSR